MLFTAPLRITYQAICFSLQTQSTKKINAPSHHSAIAVSIMRRSPFRVILREHSSLPSMQTSSLDMCIMSSCLEATVKKTLPPLRMCNHWPEKTMAVSALFSWNCRVSGPQNPQLCIFVLHRGSRGFTWATVRTFTFKYINVRQHKLKCYLHSGVSIEYADRFSWDEEESMLVQGLLTRMIGLLYSGHMKLWQESTSLIRDMRWQNMQLLVSVWIMCPRTESRRGLHVLPACLG